MSPVLIAVCLNFTRELRGIARDDAVRVLTAWKSRWPWGGGGGIVDWLVSKGSGRERSVRLAAGLLAISYGIGPPVSAFLEFRGHTLSERFDLPVDLIYLTCAVQFACSMGVLLRPFALWAAAALTVITLGAIALHLKIGSPVTAVPALLYTALQVWFGLKVHARAV